MRRVFNLFLKAAVLFVVAVVFCLGAGMLPWVARNVAEMPAKSAYLLSVTYVAAVPFFFSLYHIFKFLVYIDTGDGLSHSLLDALNKIKYGTITMSILFLAGMPAVYLIADADDAPGLIFIGAAITLVPVVIAAFAAVLQNLLQEAIDIKSETGLADLYENEGIVINISAMLIKRKISMADLSEKTGIRFQYLMGLKKAKNLNLAALADICETLDCRAEDILTYENGSGAKD